MDKPFAITLDVGSSLANKTGSWRTERAVYVDRLPPCNHACPAGENIQQWLYHAEEGGDGYERAWRQIMEDNPFPAIMGRVCYHPCETACNRGQLDEAVGINSVERFLGDEAIERGWTVEAAPRAASGKRVLVVGAGPSGLSAAYHLRRLGHEVTIHEAGPMAGGMMRFGIPKYRLPRDVLDAEVQRILDMGVTLELEHQGHEPRGVDARGRLRRGLPRRRRAHSASAPTSPPARPRASSTRSRCCAAWRARRSRCSGAAWSSTAAATPRWTWRAPPSGSAPRRRSSSTAARATACPAHDFEVEEAEEEGVLMKWLSTIKQADEGKLVIEKMELDETGFPQPTGELEELEADSLVLALGQDADLSLLDGVPGIEVEDGVVQVGPNMMTGHPGIFAGGDMVPAERTVTVGIGHGKKAARNIDGWLRGEAYEPPPKHELATFDMLNTWYYADAPRTVQPQLDSIRRQGRRSTRWSAASTSRTRCSRRAAASRAATASPATTATASAPTTRCSSSASPPRERLRDRPRLLQGLRHVRGRVPVRGDREGPGGSDARAAATKWVYDFAEGSREMRDLLGGKGSGIAEMTRLLGPDVVPAGFTITTEACVEYMRAGGTAPEGSTRRRRGARAPRGARPASGSATPTTRCSSPCAAARATRCRG